MSFLDIYVYRVITLNQLVVWDEFILFTCGLKSDTLSTCVGVGLLYLYVISKVTLYPPMV
jgi:hypothetical protein